jgi:putative tryptophan/tyrosine transport system substrate-binding protein
MLALWKRGQEILTTKAEQGLGGAAAWPLAVRPQQAAMPVVGFLNTWVPGADPHLLAAFLRGLKETGYVDC